MESDVAGVDVNRLCFLTLFFKAASAVTAGLIPSSSMGVCVYIRWCGGDSGDSGDLSWYVCPCVGDNVGCAWNGMQ